jgi:methyl-accepting chemotaxis protein
MKEPTPDPKLGTLLADKPLQMKIVSYSVLNAVIGVTVTSALAVAPLLHTMLRSNDLDEQCHAGLTFLAFYQRLLPLAAILLVAFTLHLIVVTRRIFGPLVNFRAAFSRVAQGDLTERVVVGKRDYLHRECDAINDMLAGLSYKLAQMKDDQAKLVATLQTLQVSPGNTQAAVLLESARSEARTIAERLAEFRLAPTPASQPVIPAPSGG